MILLISLFQKKIWYAYLLIICLHCLYCFSIQKTDFSAVDFFESMSAHSQLFNSEYAKKNTRATGFKALYDEFIVNHFEFCLEPRIPKIIHQIWLGSKLPEQYYIWQQTWIKNHPDWQYILWTDAEIEKLNLVNKRLYNACKSYGAKSDIARYEILYRYGGLYVDCDFECLQPFDIFHHGCDFYASCDNSENGAIIRITNALIGVNQVTLL